MRHVLASTAFQKMMAEAEGGRILRDDHDEFTQEYINASLDASERRR